MSFYIVKITIIQFLSTIADLYWTMSVRGGLKNTKTLYIYFNLKGGFILRIALNIMNSY